MVIDNTVEYDEIWDKVYKQLHFKPSCGYRGHSLTVELPFEIEFPHVVYAIEQMNDIELEIMGECIRNCMVQCSESSKWYALDWQHSAFKFDPRNKEEMRSTTVENEGIIGGEYTAFFPDFYPDGDYYFFIDEAFSNGYLGHPWRQEVWIFGEKLIEEIGKIADKLGWKIIQ